MKTKNIIAIFIINIIAILCITAIVNRTTLKRKYSDRFKPNSFILCDSILIETSPDSLYNFFIQHFSNHYTQTANDHKKFELLNSDSLEVGTQILCIEGKDIETVKHHFMVNRLIPGKHIYWSSTPTEIHVKTKNGIRKNYCNSHVYMDFEKKENYTKHTLTIVIQMPNYAYKLIRRILGGKKAKEEWENHQKEELEGLRAVYYDFIGKLK